MLTSKWFCEDSVPGKREGNVRHCFSIKKLVYRGKTKFQKVLIFDNSLYGRVFCLDDIVQLSERDEFIYHETMVHPLLFSHPHPQDVLVIGGGDGGVLREVLKHPVKKVDLVDIDKDVITLSKKYLKFVSRNAFSDKRVSVYNQPGEAFIKRAKEGSYDIAIVDCTNFVPGDSLSSTLYSLGFYEMMFSILRKEGMIVTLGASFLDFPIIKTIFKRLKKVFPYVSILRFTMPSYNCGEYSFLAASKKINLEKVSLARLEEKFSKFGKRKTLRYYSPELHKATMVLPKIWQVK